MRTSLSVLVPVSLLTFVIVFHAGCRAKHEAVEKDNVMFVVTSPLLADTSIVREYVCQIHAIQHIELRALERGYLEQILVDEGGRVRKGQPMFRIMPVIYQAEYRQTVAEAKVAEIEYLNTKALADSNVVSKNELAITRAKFDQAQARADIAKAHLDFTRMNAPFAGMMDRLHVRHGSLLEEGDMLAALSDNSSLWVYFNVPEAQYLDYMSVAQKNGQQKVRLKMANGMVFDHDGVVTTIEADFDHETGNIAFRATFPNPEALLRHGETGNILMTEPLHNALLIPQKATYEVLDKKYVFVMGNDGVVHARPITIRAELEHVYVVGGGLKAGEKILLEGIRKVKENQKIASKYVAPEEALKSLHLYAE